MIVIADTSPINYLILIGEIDVLEVLFDHVLIPSAVHAELRHPRTPHDVRSWIARPPAWLEIRTPSRTADASLARLDAGEREAILLAEEFGAEQIIIDETLARKEARRRQIPLTGTVGVLITAANMGMLNLNDALNRLRQTNFHISQSILDQIVQGHGK
jgi:predicted nucleic acid-binding protein